MDLGQSEPQPMNTFNANPSKLPLFAFFQSFDNNLILEGVSAWKYIQEDEWDATEDFNSAAAVHQPFSMP